MKTAYVDVADIRPGDRIVVSFGIVTVRGIALGVPTGWNTLYWVEEQPSVSLCVGNTWEKVIE